MGSQTALKLIDQEKITRFLGVPTMTADMTLANKSMKLKIPSLQYLGSGGAKALLLRYLNRQSHSQMPLWHPAGE